MILLTLYKPSGPPVAAGFVDCPHDCEICFRAERYEFHEMEFIPVQAETDIFPETDRFRGYSIRLAPCENEYPTI